MQKNFEKVFKIDISAIRLFVLCRHQRGRKKLFWPIADRRDFKDQNMIKRLKLLPTHTVYRRLQQICRIV